VAHALPFSAIRDTLGDGLRDAPPPAAKSLAEHLAAIFDPATLAVLHYGSHAQGRATRSDSPFDFFVVVTSYARAYQAAALTIGARCRPRLATLLARYLPPNGMSVRRSCPEGEQEAKCLIISERDFQRECSGRARDHFVQARVAQTVRLGYARDTAAADAALAAVRGARARTFDWVRVYLPPSFDLPTYCRTLLEVCFEHELRAEPQEHPKVLYSAQHALLHAVYGPLLAGLAAQGILVPDGESWRQWRPPGRRWRWQTRSYFRWNKVRTSARLLKHPLLYDDWLGYLTRKVERSTGQKITLTSREQCHPLIFLWPRVFRYLRCRRTGGR
jgi:hypothetical protein